MSLNVVDETISDASDLFRGIPCPSNEKIMRIEMQGLEKLYEENEEESLLQGGVVAGRIHSIPTVKELIESVMSEAEQIISTLPNKVLK